MNRLKTYLLLLLLVLASTAPVKAQYTASETFTVTVYEVSLIRIYPSQTINMNLLAATAGESMASVTNSSTHLQLTAIADAGDKRRVTAIISSYNNVPSGTLLKLTPSSCTSGSGSRGNVSSTITLNKTSNQTIISNVGSAYTGTGTNDGYLLTYTWQVDPANYNLLHATSTISLVITYTFSTY
jgi:hypothetical protein